MYALLCKQNNGLEHGKTKLFDILLNNKSRTTFMYNIHQAVLM